MEGLEFQVAGTNDNLYLNASLVFTVVVCDREFDVPTH